MVVSNSRNFKENELFLTGKPFDINKEHPYDQTKTIESMYRKSKTQEYTIPKIDGSTVKIKVRYVRKWFYWSAFGESSYFWNISARGKEVRERKRFVYYLVYVDGSKNPIGAVSSYITDERLDSLFYRYINKSSFEPVTITGTVRAHNMTSINQLGKPVTSSTVGKQPYLSIPDKIVESLDLHVDDLINITVTNSDGYTVTRRYHISKTNKTAVIPLSKFRRLGVTIDPITGMPTIRAVPKGRDCDPEPFTFEYGIIDQENKQEMTFIYMIPKKTALKNNLQTENIQVYSHFIEIGDTVTVHIEPVTDATRFFFNIETLMKIRSVRRRDELIYSAELNKAEEDGDTERIQYLKSQWFPCSEPDDKDLCIPVSETVQKWIDTDNTDEEDTDD